MEKIKLVLLPLLLLLASHTWADKVTVANIETATDGTGYIVINFSTTSTTLTGYQMSLYLPEGVTLQKDEDDDYEYTLSTRHNKNHVFSVNEQADGGLLLVCYSPTKKLIATGEGELLRLPINVAATATGTLTAQLKTIKFSDTSSNVTQMDDVSFDILMPEPPTVPDRVTVAQVSTNADGHGDIIVCFSTTATTLTGYQMSLYLPEGVTVQKDEDDDYEYTLSTRHNKNHVFSVNEQADGGLLLVCYSPTKKLIATGEGELLRLPINVAATATGTLTAQLKTIKFSDTSSNVTQMEDVSFNIEIQSQQPQKAEQTLSLIALPTMTCGDDAYTLPATTTEGLPLTWVSSNTAVATISEGKLITKGAGTTTITATQAGNDSYLPFTREFTLTVNEAPPTPSSSSTLYTADFSVRHGESELLSLQLDNEEEVIMAEFYMQLPEGVTIATDQDGYYDATLNGDRTDRTHSIEVELGSDGLYHFLVYSTKNKPFTGSEGELISVKLNCAASVEAGTYEGKLRSILLSNKDKQAINLEDRTFAIEVTDYILGDVNDDRRINGMDIVEMVELIMTQGYAKAADLYPIGQPDGVVNGMDLVEEVELVMSQTAAPETAARGENGMHSGLTLTQQLNGTLAIGVDNGRQYIMAQCVVELSEGMQLNDVTTDMHHAVAWRHIDGSRYMVVAYSGSNCTFTNNEVMLSLHCTGEGLVTVTDVLMADANRQECHFAAVSTGATTGIAIMHHGDTINNNVYDLQGRCVNAEFKTPNLKARPGLYIVDGKKKVVK